MDLTTAAALVAFGVGSVAAAIRAYTDHLTAVAEMRTAELKRRVYELEQELEAVRRGSNPGACQFGLGAD